MNPSLIFALAGISWSALLMALRGRAVYGLPGGGQACLAELPERAVLTDTETEC